MIRRKSLSRTDTSQAGVAGRAISYSLRESTVGKRASGSVQWDETLGDERTAAGPVRLLVRPLA